MTNKTALIISGILAVGFTGYLIYRHQTAKKVQDNIAKEAAVKSAASNLKPELFAV